MNLIALSYLALGLLAFPLCVIGITILAGCMLAGGRIGRERESNADRHASLERVFRHA